MTQLKSSFSPSYTQHTGMNHLHEQIFKESMFKFLFN